MTHLNHSGTLVGLTKTVLDMCCLKGTNLNESIGSPHPQPTMNINPTLCTKTIHLGTLNAQLWCYKIVFNNNKQLERCGTRMKTFTQLVVSPSQSLRTLVGLAWKLSTWMNLGMLYTKYTYPKPTSNQNSTLCTTSIHLETPNIHIWCIMLAHTMF